MERLPKGGLRCGQSGFEAVDEGIVEATLVVGFRMVLMMWIYGRGWGVRSCSGRLDEGARKRI